MTTIWTPGHAGPLDELLGRLTHMVSAFSGEHGLEQAEVRLELVDGSRFTLESWTPEPGFGFFSFTPHRNEGDEPKRIVIPIGAVRSIEISAPDPERSVGFVTSD
jgi:hypothetical protein